MKKKENTNNLNILFVILTVFFAILSIVFAFLIKNQNSNAVYAQIEKEYKTEASRYSEIYKNSEADVLNYMSNKIDYDFLPSIVLEDMFATCYPKFSDEGKAELYTIYYANWSNLLYMYQDILDTARYKYLLYDFATKHPDANLNKPEVYRQISNVSLRSVLEEIQANHLVVTQNGEYFEVTCDFDWFYNKYYDILTDEMRDFVELDVLSSQIVAENRTDINMTVIENIILKSADFIENGKTPTLKNNALQLLRQGLRIYLNCNGSYFLYDDLNKFTMSDDVLETYSIFVSSHKDYNISNLVSDVLNVYREKAGKGEPLDLEIAEMIDKFLISEGYATTSDIYYISEKYDKESMINTSSYVDELEESVEEDIEDNSSGSIETEAIEDDSTTADTNQ